MNFSAKHAGSEISIRKTLVISHLRFAPKTDWGDGFVEYDL
jgi:hypothetical protein